MLDSLTFFFLLQNPFFVNICPSKRLNGNRGKKALTSLIKTPLLLGQGRYFEEILTVLPKNKKDCKNFFKSTDPGLEVN